MDQQRVEGVQGGLDTSALAVTKMARPDSGPANGRTAAPPADGRPLAVASSLMLGELEGEAATTVPLALFDAAYSGTELFLGVHERACPPWEIGRPQPSVVRLAAAGLITGRVLDIGCGTGENSLYLTSCGLEVVGVDASSVAIAKARAKAEERGLGVQFVVGDALDLAALGETFDTAIDTGVLHIFSDADRARYVAGLRSMLRPGGRYHLVCFSQFKEMPAPRRLTKEDIRATFRPRWEVESIIETRYEVRDGSTAANAWQASICPL